MVILPIARSLLNAAMAGKEAVLDLILPPTCRLCNLPVGGGEDFCKSCDTALTISEPLMQAACRRCGIPSPRCVTQSVATRSEENAGSTDSTADLPRNCVQCKKSKSRLNGMAVLWSYQDRVCEAVVAAKYAHQSPLGDALGRRLGARVKSVFAGDLPDLVTYVPSHVTRQFSRGGNGNQVIASAVAKVIGRRCRLLLRTTRRVQKQAWLDDTRRIENVRDAFSLKKSYAFARSNEILQRHILVVDDVLTTGATVNEVARTLLQGGAQRVSVGVVARAIRS